MWSDICDTLLIIVQCSKFRYFVLHRLPRLTFLDSSFVTAEERKEAQRIGAFMRVVRPSDSIVSTSVKLYSMISSLSLLPAIRVNLALRVLSCLFLL